MRGDGVGVLLIDLVYEDMNYLGFFYSILYYLSLFGCLWFMKDDSGKMFHDAAPGKEPFDINLSRLSSS